MGQDQSNLTNYSSGSSTSNKHSVTSSFSFLTKKREKAENTNQIIVVNSSNNNDVDKSNDENLKKIKEIPRFMPILQELITSKRNFSTNSLKKINQNNIYLFLQRLQTHFTSCRQYITKQQTPFFTRIFEINQEISLLSRQVAQKNQNLDLFINEMRSVDVLNKDLEKVQLLLNVIMPVLISLNELLPESDRISLMETQISNIINS